MHVIWWEIPDLRRHLTAKITDLPLDADKAPPDPGEREQHRRESVEEPASHAAPDVVHAGEGLAGTPAARFLDSSSFLPAHCAGEQRSGFALPAVAGGPRNVGRTSACRMRSARVQCIS